MAPATSTSAGAKWLRGHPVALQLSKALSGGVIVGVVQFDAGPVATSLLRGRQGRTAAAERVQHQIAGLREPLDKRRQGFDGFLRRMQPVACVRKVQHVRDRLGRQGRIGVQSSEARAPEPLPVGETGG